MLQSHNADAWLRAKRLNTVVRKSLPAETYGDNSEEDTNEVGESWL